MTGSNSVLMPDGGMRSTADPQRAMTGGSEADQFLLPQLRESLRSAVSADIIVSFLMESGVRLLIDELKSAIARGVRIRILTGNYLGITQPEALYTLRRELGDNIDLRVCLPPEAGSVGPLHAKSYMFHYADGRTEVYVGSSNISRSALTNGIEWNYRLDSIADAASTAHFERTFNDLFAQHALAADDAWLAAYAAGWHCPPVLYDTETKEFMPQYTGA